MKYKNIFNIDLFEDGLIIKNVNTTCDINIDSIEHESKKFYNTVSRFGLPPEIDYRDIQKSIIKKA